MTPLLKLWFSIPEKLRFLLIGGWNTFFSFLLFIIIFQITGNYKITLVIAHILSVMQSFVSFRFLVFRRYAENNNFIMEYIKINIVYGVYFCLNFVLLWFAVDFLALKAVPSQFIITCFLVTFSYFGNKYFTFKNGTKRKR